MNSNNQTTQVQFKNVINIHTYVTHFVPEDPRSIMHMKETLLVYPKILKPPPFPPLEDCSLWGAFIVLRLLSPNGIITSSRKAIKIVI